MNDIASYLGIGIALIFAIYLVALIRRPIFLQLAFKKILSSKKEFFLLIILVTLIASIFSSVTFMNSSYEKFVNESVSQKVGVTNGIIYSRNSEARFNQREISQIYSLVLNEFNGYLPLYLKKVTFDAENPNTLITYFDPTFATSYSREFTEKEKYQNLKENEIIVSKSLAAKYNLQEGQEFDLKELPNKQFRIKHILDDNGVLGFNLQLPSQLKSFDGSIYISSDFYKKNISEEILYNSILLKTSANYTISELNSYVQNELNQRNRELVFEEIKYSYANSLYGTSGLSLAQVVLVISTLPLVGLFIIYFLVGTTALKKEKGFESILRVSGFSTTDLIILDSFQNSICSFVGALFGGVIGYFLSSLYFNILGRFFQSGDLQKLEIDFSINSYLISFGVAFLLFSLINFLLLFRSTSDDRAFDIAKNKVIRNKKVFSLKESSFAIVGVLGTLVIFYYSYAGFITDVNARNLVLFFNYQLSLSLFSFFLISFKPKFKTITINLVTVVVFVFNLYIYKFFGLASIWDENPVIYFINALLLLIAGSFFLLNNLNFIKFLIQRIFRNSKNTFPALNLAVGLTGRNANIINLILISLFFVTVLVFPIGQNIISQIKENIGNKYNLIISDSLGQTTTSEFVEKIGKDAKKVLSVSYTSAKLPDFTYQNIGLGQKAYSNNEDPNTPISESVSTLDESALQELSFRSNLSKEAIISKFTENSNFIILGNNYNSPLTEENIHGDIRVGDKVKVQFDKDIVVEREVIALIQNLEETQLIENNSTTSNLFSKKGFFISLKDSEKLTAENKIFFSKLYGVAFKDGIDKEKAEKELRKNIETEPISSIFDPTTIFVSSLEFFSILLTLANFNSYLSILIIFIALVLSFMTNIRENKNNFMNLIKSGASSKFIYKSYLGSFIILLFSSFVIGITLTYWSTHKFYEQAILPLDNTVQFYFPFERLPTIGLVVLIGAILSAAFLYIQLNKFLNINGKK